MHPPNGRPAESNVDLDEVFTALSSRRRRMILVELMEDNPRDAQEFETVEVESSDVDQETISLQLHHAHLPQLDAAGFIDWTARTGKVTRGEHFEDIRPLLELMDEHRDELPDDWP